MYTTSTQTRRDLIASSVVPVSLLILHTSPENAVASVRSLPFSSINEVVQYINHSCNRRFLQSVRSSCYNFLYRGTEINASSRDTEVSAFIIKDTYDLLDPNTYQSTDAVAYFQRLEDKLSLSGYNVKPSNGHLATTCQKDAAKWGRPMSIWPIGDTGVDFIWLASGGVFWPLSDPSKELEIASEPLQRLDKALQGDAWEIMFRADNGVLAVPAEFDEEMRYLLKHAS
ncbi:hypothetical protein ACHAWO_005214 [Cyclotella atomus]|uniref:F-box domain-containing protein n=1 Tax=Cyclotella atomus TaxID=382360 RepID=A0ABD3MWX5_9STRA